MRKKILTFVVAFTLALVVALPVLRYFAPQLVGVPVDLQMVQVAEAIPSYFDGVFRDEDFEGTEMFLRDPFVQRARPLFLDGGSWGPHDLLGFRNAAIPVVADIVTIGDSMTYGMGEVFSQTWPQQLREELSQSSPVVYNMAIGGWGAAEYLQIFPRALRFRPRVVVVAFYTGNDPRDTFSRVYRRDDLADLRLDESATASDLPKVEYPAPESEWWLATFRDGSSTTFTPKLRHGSNLDHPAIDLAYDLMAEVGRRIQAMAAETDTRVVFTILPTKELTLAQRVQRDGLEAPRDYETLIQSERRHITNLAEELQRIPGALYVDSVEPMQRAALQSEPMFPPDIDGHPLAAGHRAIARAVGRGIKPLVPKPLDGAVRVVYDRSNKRTVYAKRILIRGAREYLHRYLLVRDGRMWRFRSLEVFEANGWDLDSVPSVAPRDIANLVHAGTIESTDAVRFGPRQVAP